MKLQVPTLALISVTFKISHVQSQEDLEGAVRHKRYQVLNWLMLSFFFGQKAHVLSSLQASRIKTAEDVP